MAWFIDFSGIGARIDESSLALVARLAFKETAVIQEPDIQAGSADRWDRRGGVIVGMPCDQSLVLFGEGAVVDWHISAGA